MFRAQNLLASYLSQFIKRIDLSAEVTKFNPCASRHLRAMNNLLKLSIMLFLYGCLSYLLSILSWLIDPSESHSFMLFWSISYSWNYAFMIVSYAGIKFKCLLKLLILQQILAQSSKNIFYCSNSVGRNILYILQ